MSLYVNQKTARDSILRAEFIRQKLERAVDGESLAKLSGLTNKEARLINSTGKAVIPFAAFNRADENERRAERIFRSYLLPGVMELVSTDFIINWEGIKTPQNFTEIGSLVLQERSISVVRTMLSAQEPDEQALVDPSKLLEHGTLPGIVGFQMLVEGNPGLPATAGQV